MSHVHCRTSNTICARSRAARAATDEQEVRDSTEQLWKRLLFSFPKVTACVTSGHVRQERATYTDSPCTTALTPLYLNAKMENPVFRSTAPQPWGQGLPCSPSHLQPSPPASRRFCHSEQPPWHTPKPKQGLGTPVASSHRDCVSTSTKGRLHLGCSCKEHHKTNAGISQQRGLFI